MAILFPALRIAREQGRSISCRSNVRTLTMAWLMYKDANDGKLVGGNTPASSRSPWVLNAPGEGNASIEEKKEYIKRGHLWPFVKDIGSYRCPSDRRQKSPYHRYAYRTYSITGGMNGVNPNGGWEIIPCINYTDIKNPATKYVFLAMRSTRTQRRILGDASQVQKMGGSFRHLAPPEQQHVRLGRWPCRYEQMAERGPDRLESGGTGRRTKVSSGRVVFKNTKFG